MSIPTQEAVIADLNQATKIATEAAQKLEAAVNTPAEPNKEATKLNVVQYVIFSY